MTTRTATYIRTLERATRIVALLLLAWLPLGMVGSSGAHASGQEVNKKRLQSAFAHYSQARSLADHRQFSEAVVEYREALRRDPDEPYWYQALGAVLEREGNSQEALDAYSRATELSPDDFGLHSHLQALRERVVAGLGAGGAAAISLDDTPRPTSGPNMSQPHALYEPNPPYSEKARLVQLSGVVVLKIDLDAQGNVLRLTDVKPLGLGLDENAIETVRIWKFSPARRDGRPVATQLGVEVTFRLLTKGRH